MSIYINSKVQLAFSEYRQGNFVAALQAYRELAKQIGQKNFKANILLCEAKLSANRAKARNFSSNSRPDDLAKIKVDGDIPKRNFGLQRIYESSLHTPRTLGQSKQLRIASILDEFSYNCFAPEGQFLQLKADRWQQQIEEFNPDFVFIESAWRGCNDTWLKKVSELSTELILLIDWAKKHDVSTVFWCKEDPVHFTRFLPVARLVDHVFTTDIGSISQYKDALHHNRIYLLPFAAQPILHNPVETFGRKDGFSFAGSWYPNYPDRQVDFRTLVRVARKLGPVEIWDRNLKRTDPHNFSFPEEFQGEIKGCLPHNELDRAYKGCRFGITVNTIKQSQTMFARRAIELMASNTVVISNFSKGLRMLFGDHVISSDSAVELEHRLAPLFSDDGAYRRHRLAALRKVLTEHTYEHRLAYIASKLLGQPFAAAHPHVALLAEPANEGAAQRLIAVLERQTWVHARLVLVGTPLGAAHPRVERVSDRAAALASLADFDYVAPICAADYYGPDYLTDLVLATRFALGDGVTKASFYAADNAGNITLLEDGSAYRSVSRAALRRSLLRQALLLAWTESPASRIEDSAVMSNSLLAVDEFGYCQDGADWPTLAVQIDVGELLRAGVSLEGQLLPRAESEQVASATADVDSSFMLYPKDWYHLLPKKNDCRLRLRLDDQYSASIDAMMPPDEYQYLYLSRRFTPAELKADRETFFQLEADARLDIRTVFVFNDAKSNKIAHVMHTVGARHSLSVPPGTVSVRLALRVQGTGKARLGRLTLAESRGLPPQVVPVARHLIVANHYPDYDDLYRYGFVHSRVRAYAREGLPVEVLRISSDPRVTYREFENIDVTEADCQRLEQCLVDGCYESLLVHIIDQRIWNVVRQHLHRIRVVIWVHGSEIQPWWRRAMNQDTDSLRDQARRKSDARFALWREILGLAHPNLRVVFISNKQAAEALCDLQLPAAAVGGLQVISNFIDGDLFCYQPKKPALRHRILSIRPFFSRVYANDLSVAAILRLVHEPFFDQLKIHIVGDGALFEETVAPLRVLPNVKVTQAFLTQREIAALHRDYGVFLVPSRMDSQGVSRDEAMASGLVPVTNRVAAIPEFVDSDCGFLAEPEDAESLAAAIVRMHEDPTLFERLSENAARRVRTQSGHAQTITRELALFAGFGAPDCLSPLRFLVSEEAAATRIALYGDVNLNVMDGSAIWAASLAEVLGGLPKVRVSLFLKARIHRTQVIARLLDMAPTVQLIEPDVPNRGTLGPAEAVDHLVSIDALRPFRAFILRGLDVCWEAAQHTALEGRLWAYLTDIPQSARDLDDVTRQRIENIIEASEWLLCQTPQIRDFFISQFPMAAAKMRLLPPMVPPSGFTVVKQLDSQPFRYCYAGKFAPRWGIRELFAAHARLLDGLPDAELHLFGDKIHNPPDDPVFQTEVKTRLESGKGLLWHGAVDRDELLRRLATMHVCWAYRDADFERETLELSTKALEYASLNIPVIMARSALLEAVFGADYPLFAASAEDAAQLLRGLAREPALGLAAVDRLKQVAEQYTFAKVRARILAEGWLDIANLGPTSSR